MCRRRTGSRERRIRKPRPPREHRYGVRVEVSGGAMLGQHAVGGRRTSQAAKERAFRGVAARIWGTADRRTEGRLFTLSPEMTATWRRAYRTRRRARAGRRGPSRASAREHPPRQAIRGSAQRLTDVVENSLDGEYVGNRRHGRLSVCCCSHSCHCRSEDECRLWVCAVLRRRLSCG